MIQVRKQSEKARDSPSPNTVILSRISVPALDLNTPLHQKVSSSNKESALEDGPLCRLNLKETSEFVRAFSMASAQRRRMEAPATPGRPFAGNLSRKGVPSKWDDAEKWLMGGSCHESPAHVTRPVAPAAKVYRAAGGGLPDKGEASAEKMRFVDEKDGSFEEHLLSLDPDEDLYGLPPDVVLQDKFTDNVAPPTRNFLFSSATNHGYFIRGSCYESLEPARTEAIYSAQRRDVATETTPRGSMTATRRHAPLKSSTPPRHNTPADISGPLVASNTTFDISEFRDCHFAKLQLSAQYGPTISNWSSREEEEAEVSKSLRHSEGSNAKKSYAKTGASLWEAEERSKICIRYRREEAKIQAWLNLQSAKAEARSRKLEVKIEKMRSNLEEKLMKRMSRVERKAEEWRAAAQLQHSQQILRASQQAQKMRSLQTSSNQVACGCFPCNKNTHLYNRKTLHEEDVCMY